MINTSAIKPGMPVICSQGGQFAVVDHLDDDDFIKLKRNEVGIPHYIPASWVTSTNDDKVHIDRPGKQAMDEWATSPLYFLDRAA